MSDTPRTDAEWSSTWQTERRLHELCQQLERELAKSQEAYLQSVERDDYLTQELAASKAEVAELNRLMIGWQQRTTMSEMDLEASKAEIHRLKAIPHFHHESYCRKCGELK